MFRSKLKFEKVIPWGGTISPYKRELQASIKEGETQKEKCQHQPL